MGNIVILDENTSNKIAAGEVIERPASVVKELVENSIDAGAEIISVEIKNGGITYIKVTDNGSGIAGDDVEIAFERHATSKIRNSGDLESISTLGFRGEALASIASVSSVDLTTRVKKNPHGSFIKVQGGVVKEASETGCPAGTTFVVRDLFYNTPARFKFLKKDSTEAGYVADIINRMALGNPGISFRLTSNNTTILHSPGNNDLLSTIFSVYGKETAKEVAEINYSDNNIKITGYAGKPEIARSSRSFQSIFINKRYVKSKVVTSAIDEAYKTYLMKNKFPFIVMNLEINPVHIDVNVHPTKMEVRFSEEQEVFRSIYHAVTNALLGKSLVRNIEVQEKDKRIFRFEEKVRKPVEYKQQRLVEDRGHVRETPDDADNGRQGNVSNNYIITDEPLRTVKTESIKSIVTNNINRNNSQDEENNNSDLTVERINLLEGSKLLGQVFSTYIMLQHGEELLIIDQHAAHERLMYEKLKSKYEKNEALAQILITPAVFELTYQEIKFLQEKREFFNKLGFIYEEFGNNSIILRAVPYAENGAAVKEVFIQVIDTLMNSTRPDYSKVYDDAIYTIACKAAVKANKKLDASEVEELLRLLSEIDNPYTCPHGRPTIIKMTKYELEKRFKRII